jgi:S-formylglutathione hydrolase FrmB
MMILSAKHPDLFVAAASMSGVMNIDTRLWKVDDNFRTLRQQWLQDMLGQDLNYDAPNFNTYTAVGLVKQMKCP